MMMTMAVVIMVMVMVMVMTDSNKEYDYYDGIDLYTAVKSRGWPIKVLTIWG